MTNLNNFQQDDLSREVEKNCLKFKFSYLGRSLTAIASGINDQYDFTCTFQLANLPVHATG